MQDIRNSKANMITGAWHDRDGAARIYACGDSRLRGPRSRKPIGFRQWVVHYLEINRFENTLSLCYDILDFDMKLR